MVTATKKQQQLFVRFTFQFRKIITTEYGLQTDIR